MNLKRMIVVLLSITGLIIAIVCFMNLPRFGKLPKGKRLERITQSPNYRNGAFQNMNYTPVMAEENNFFGVMKKMVKKRENLRPANPIPSMKTDLFAIDRSDDVLVWFGHSSYFIQLEGKRILVDPVFSGHASPVPFLVKAFKGSDRYTPDDIPDIDYLVITHDHWDHLDYKTVKKLQPKIKQVICGLGVGEHLEHWGFPVQNIIEMDWNETVKLDQYLTIHSFPARHFSGRGLVRNKSLWSSFVVESQILRVFIGGDGGYDSHFTEIKKKFGAIDLAILENGQYNESWKYIHSLPDEVIKEAIDMNATRVLPVHSSKFKLSIHEWDEPLKRISQLAGNSDILLVTPMIGEPVFLRNKDQSFTRWWESN